MLSELAKMKGVQSLGKHRLNTLKGGCNKDSCKTTYTYKDKDDKYGDDGCTSGGEEGFIPPPGT